VPKYHVMKAHRGSGGNAHTFLFSVKNRGEKSAPYTGRFTPTILPGKYSRYIQSV